MFLMMQVLASFATWRSTVHYSLDVADCLCATHAKKCQGEYFHLAKDIFPKIFEQRNGLRKDIEIYLVSSGPQVKAYGSNFGPTPVLCINKNISIDSPENFSHLCEKELSCIYSNKQMITPYLAALISAISTSAIPSLRSCLPHWAAPISYLIPSLVGRGVYEIVDIFFKYFPTQLVVLSSKEIQKIEAYLQQQKRAKNAVKIHRIEVQPRKTYLVRHW